MKRAFAGIVLVAAAVVSCVPYVMGVHAQATYLALLARVTQQAADVRLVPESYQRGWLSSRADMRVEIPPGTPVLWLHHRIMHGPMPWDRLRAGEIRPVQAVIDTRITAAATGKEFSPLGARTVLALDGSGLTEIGAPADQVQAPGKGKSTVHWEGLHGSIRFPRDLLRIDGAVEAPGLHVSTADSRWSMADLKFRLDLHQGLEGLTLGDVSASVSGLAYQPEGDEAPPVRLAGWRMRTGSKAQGSQVAVDLEVRVEGVDLGDTHYGPASLAAALSRLDAPTLGRLRREMRALEREGLTDKEARLGAAFRLMELLPRLLAVGPEFDLRLVGATPAGTLRGTAVVRIDPGPEELPVFSSGWLARLQANVDVQIPASLVDAMLQERDESATRGEGKNTPLQNESEAGRKQLRTLRDRGYLLQQDGEYVFRLRYQDRRLTLNGRPFSFSLLSAS